MPAFAYSTERSQLQTFGDTAARIQIDAQLRQIYDLTSGPGQQLLLLSQENPLELPDAVGTELTASLIDGSEARIVGVVWTRKGKYSFEFYRSGGRLLMAYETFTYFPATAPRNAWRNFMGLPGWESRTYFDTRGAIAYAEIRGRRAAALHSHCKGLPQQADRLVKLLERSATHWERK